MKRPVYSAVLLRWRLIKINIVNTWQTETAYFGNGWGNVLSTIAFTLSYLLFVTVIYANVRSLAGFSRDQMLFLLLFIQVNFYLLWGWCHNNISRLVEDVNRGNFDLLLVKPLPSLFYASTRTISLLPQLRDGLPALSCIVISINWHNISVSPVALLAGIVICTAGQLAMNGFLFLLALPVFWFGQASDLTSLGLSFSGTELPYGGIEPRLRLFLTLIIPTLVPASLSVAVMLGKFSLLEGLCIALFAAILLQTCKAVVWKQALRSYTSASS